MTEEKLEAIMEHMGDAIERMVEGAANKFDKSVNRAWKHRPVRVIGKGIACLSGAGLVIAAFPLFEKGQNMAAKICLISGGIVIAANVIELFIIKRK